MIPAALFLVLLLIVGFVATEEYRKRRITEATIADQQVTIDEQADGAAERLAQVAALEGTVTRLREALDIANDAAAKEHALVKRYRDKLADAEMFRTVADAEAERNATALRGLLTHLARQELIEPDRPSEVADVVEMPVRGVRG